MKSRHLSAALIVGLALAGCGSSHHETPSQEKVQAQSAAECSYQLEQARGNATEERHAKEYWCGPGTSAGKELEHERSQALNERKENEHRQEGQQALEEREGR